jgi:hypothetical protein
VIIHVKIRNGYWVSPFTITSPQPQTEYFRIEEVVVCDCGRDGQRLLCTTLTTIAVRAESYGGDIERVWILDGIW